MPIKYRNGKSKEYSASQPEPEIPPEPEIQNEEIVIEPSPPPPSQEAPQYDETPQYEEENKNEYEEENKNEWELGEEDARNIAMIIVSIASFMPYWPAKKRELEEKYGSIEEFRAQYEENLRKALGHPWVQKVVRNISWIQHLTLIPFLIQTFELFSPPKEHKENEERIENVEIPQPTQSNQSVPEYTPPQRIVEGAFTIND
jgi:hypothetical protein